MLPFLILLEGSLSFVTAYAVIRLWPSRMAAVPGGGADLAGAIVIALGVVAAFYYTDQYDPTVARSFRDFLRRLPLSVGLALLLIVPGAAALTGMHPPTGGLYVALIAAFGLQLPFRAASYRARERRPFDERLLVVGDGPLGCRLVDEIEARPHLRCDIVGVVSEAATGRLHGRPVLGHLDDLDAVLRDTVPDRVVLALKERRGSLPLRQLLDARLRGAEIEDVVDALERLTGKLSIEALSPGALIFGGALRGSQGHRIASRLLSLIVAIIGLALLMPLGLAIALLIKLDSRGAVLFLQDRLGLGGRTFRLLKFRTMRPDDHPSSEWADDNRHRITRVGRLLRRYRLDELPQFINMLRGDMNLVGPRPHPTCNLELFEETIPYYRVRATVRPGVTGWAQVRQGYANGLEEETEKMRFDLHYIKHRSLALDLRILADTVRIVLGGRETSDPAKPAAAAIPVAPARAGGAGQRPVSFLSPLTFRAQSHRRLPMKRATRVVPFILILILFAGIGLAAGADFDPHRIEAMRRAAPGQPIEAIVTHDHRPVPAGQAALRGKP